MIAIQDDEFTLMSAFLEKTTGITVPTEKRYLFTTRLGDFLKETGFADFRGFYVRLKAPGSEGLVKKLTEFMTTNETSFFRDAHPFRALKDSVLSSRLSPGRKFHVWSAGCSTGQEPYSIAMTILDWLRSNPRLSADQVSVYASDISERILEKARTGIYTDEEVQRGLADEQRGMYFARIPQGWQVAPEVRRMVKFSVINLSEPFAMFGRFDMIFCRNVTIYFSQALKQRILTQFCQMLLPKGILVLGASETIYPDLGCYKSTGVGDTLFFEKVS